MAGRGRPSKVKPPEPAPVVTDAQPVRPVVAPRQVVHRRPPGGYRCTRCGSDGGAIRTSTATVSYVECARGCTDDSGSVYFKVPVAG